jgi:hypothetical protein
MDCEILFEVHLNWQFVLSISDPSAALSTLQGLSAFSDTGKMESKVVAHVSNWFYRAGVVQWQNVSFPK